MQLQEGSMEMQEGSMELQEGSLYGLRKMSVEQRAITKVSMQTP